MLLIIDNKIIKPKSCNYIHSGAFYEKTDIQCTIKKSDSIGLYVNKYIGNLIYTNTESKYSEYKNCYIIQCDINTDDITLLIKFDSYKYKENFKLLLRKFKLKNMYGIINQ